MATPQRISPRPNVVTGPWPRSGGSRRQTAGLSRNYRRLLDDAEQDLIDAPPKGAVFIMLGDDGNVSAILSGSCHESRADAVYALMRLVRILTGGE